MRQFRRHWADGGKGAIELAEMVIAAAEQPSEFKFLYDLDQPIKAKIETIATKIYGAEDVSYSVEADEQIADYEASGFGESADLHGKNASEPQPRSDAERAPPDLHCRSVRCGRASVQDLFIRSAATCGQCRPCPHTPQPSRSTSTRTATLWGCFDVTSTGRI